ncbi:MAG: hypothetical protein BroJett011_14310 [Chloroflexota bacterium]|jgi:hypothetical protein|nr:MAG: hypothetical protein BroJett011_14310 [Chloroflexota bacterium]
MAQSQFTKQEAEEADKSVSSQRLNKRQRLALLAAYRILVEHYFPSKMNTEAAVPQEEVKK